VRIVLLSGGVDSTTALALSIATGAVETVTVDYGQIHHRELTAAAAVAAHYNVRNTLITVNGLWFDSALTGLYSIPEGHAENPDATYVPGRNTILLALAASRAESIGADSVVIGCNKDDAAGYPDCRPEYLNAFQKVIAAGAVNPVQVDAPLLHMSKQEVIALARELGAPLGLTYSCYRGGKVQCGRCGACESNGVTCPTA
jgi:7-cyano-7-deazaguanine synthase